MTTEKETYNCLISNVFFIGMILGFFILDNGLYDYIIEQKKQFEIKSQQISKIYSDSKYKIIETYCHLTVTKQSNVDIYHLIDDLTATGLSIIFISSEMPELINMCDRIVVMNQGHTTGILNRNEFNQEKIMAFATKEIG